MTDNEPRYEKERSRIDRAALAADDRDLLNQFDSELSRNNSTGAQQHANHLQRLRVIAEHRAPPLEVAREGDRSFHGIALADVLTDEEAAKEVLDWINNLTHRGNDLSEKSRTHYRGAIRIFGALVTDAGPRGDEIPPSVRVIPGGDPRQKSEKDPAPRPGEIHWWDPDIIRILELPTIHEREAAFIALGWDSGARPGELLGLTWGDVDEDRGFYRITVGGKDHPQRDPLCVVATPYFRRWLEFGHPANHRDGGFTADTPIWTHYDSVEAVSGSRLRDMLSDISDEIGMEKPFTPKWLRKSRASIVAMRDGISQTKLENRFGWVRGSQVAAHYVARFNEDTDADVAEGDGLPEGLLERETDDREDPAPVRCPNCEQWTPRHRDECMFCTAEFAADSAEEADIEATLQEEVDYRERRDEFMSHVVEDDVDPDEIDFAVRFGDFLADNEDAVEAAENLRSALDGE